jgi:hypothetical protein
METSSKRIAKNGGTNGLFSNVLSVVASDQNLTKSGDDTILRTIPRLQ